MPKVKISEYSSTANSNTDVASINIDEGCAPSGINNAIRAVMGHLKDFQTGAVGDSFNGPVGATTASTGAFTTLTTSGAVIHNGGTANGVAYLNGSKVVTSGSALVFDGTNLVVGNASALSSSSGRVDLTLNGASSGGILSFGTGGVRKGYIYQDSTDFTIANEVAGAMRFINNGSERMRLDSSGNLGLGVTPSAWGSTYRMQQIGNGASVGGRTAAITQAYLSANWYQDGSGNKYIGTGAATQYQQDSGTHYWFNAPSGTAGSALTFTQAMTLTAAGDLGIGTTSPSNFSGYGTITVNGSSGGIYDVMAAGTRQASFFFDTGGAVLQTNNSYPILFKTAGTEKARIDSSGNLGLGVTPSAWGSGSSVLQNPGGSLWNFGTGSLNVSCNNYFDGSNYRYRVNGNASYYNQSSGIHAWYNAASGTAGNAITFTQAMTLDASGNLGVGTTAPQARLNVRTSDTYGLIVNTNNVNSGTTRLSLGGYLDAAGGTGGTAAIGAIHNHSATAQSSLTFYTHDGTTLNERARIDSSGNLLVGVTSSSRKLSVEGSNAGTAFLHNLRNTSGDNALIMQLGGANTNNTSSNYIFCDTDSVGVRMVVYGNGNIQNVNNSYGAYSDIKIKENITDATPKLADLMQVQIRNYNLIGEQTRQIGVIAQELEQVFPSMIEESPDRDREGNDLGTTTKSVKYSVFVPMLIKALQEQQAMIASQSELITSLTARLDAANL
jgi:hypothetical protein